MNPAPWIIISLICLVQLSHSTHHHQHSKQVKHLVDIENVLLEYLEERKRHGEEARHYSSQEDANTWLKKYGEQASIRQNKLSNLNWDYLTNLTDANAKVVNDYSLIVSEWTKEQEKIANRYLKEIPHIGDYDIKRKLTLISRTAELRDKNKLKESTTLNNEMEKIYGSATLCNGTTCYVCEPDLENIMASSRDYDELLWVWKGWRNVINKSGMKQKYVRFVDLINEGAKENGYADMSEYWMLSNYEETDLEAVVDKLWEEVKPLYQQLHAYVRKKLIEKYPGRGIEEDGSIPAHLLGNMWAQQWNNILDIVLPYPDVEAVDVTSEMKKQGYNPLKMFKTAENFFDSLGLPKMTRYFWERSMFVKPKDRNVQCHGSAQDFSNSYDFRIKMCTQVNQEDFITIHHEMGHVEYYMAYSKQPMLYRAGANSGFHEAAGDTVALSVMTPKHLNKVGLLKPDSNQDPSTKEKADINFLMAMALQKIAFLPFGLLIDKWRWEVFRGHVKETDYNKKWWDLRLKYQGLKPPVPRSDDGFDPGAKYHIPSNTPYIRYFVSYIIQFQFHAALCEAAGYTGPPHQCDIYGSTAAGSKFNDMLSMGRERPWPKAMKVLTGQDKMDTSKIKAYFKPLTDWLEKENGNDIGWKME